MLGAHRFSDQGGEPVRGALVVGFHHDSNHLLGSGGAQQDSPGITEFVLGLGNRRANRGRGSPRTLAAGVGSAVNVMWQAWHVFSRA